MAELDSHYFNTKDNVRIHYQCNFDIKKTPQEIIVFNYGLVCSDLHWKYQIEHFKKNHPILIYNYRGHFQSTGRKKLETLTIQQFSDDLFEIIKFIKAKKVILIGHSMGVNVCLQFCIDHPELVKKQVLISGAIISAREIMLDSNLMDIIIPHAKNFKSKYPKLFKAFWKSTPFMLPVRKMIHFGGFNYERVNDEFVQMYLSRVAKLGPDVFFKLFDSMSDHGVSNEFPKIKTDTFIISGVKDKVIPHVYQEYMANNMPNATLYSLPEGSHVPQVDFPKAINKKIEYFLKR